MPWKPTYTREMAAEAISRADTWSEALEYLGLSPYGKNMRTIRKWAAEWRIAADHLPPYRPRGTGPRFTEAEARLAIATSKSWSEALRRLDYCPTGGNPGTLKRWAETWEIPTDHFDPYAASREALKKHWHKPRALTEVLTEHSTIARTALKERLYEAGLKERRCELCGQGERWNGMQMSLIIDHENGVRDDNRLENLRIVCPNCAATLETHCGRAHPGRLPPERTCQRCGKAFRPKYRGHRYCSRECGSRWDRGPRGAGVPQIHARRVDRPARLELIDEIERLGYLAVGRKYGVSDNAIRKWVRQYERERAVEEGRDPQDVEIPTRTWPNRQRGSA
jgi:hypothetical protein